MYQLDSYSRPSALLMQKLEGTEWVIEGTSLFFHPQDPDNRGQRPFLSGSEAYAYPLLNSEKKKTAFFKIFREHSALRQERTEFLAGLNLPDLSAVLWASPSRLMDIQQDGYLKDPGTDRNFCGSFMQAVPGCEWRDLKFNISESTLILDAPFRLRCIQDLLLGLCVLKEKEMLHGDLSPGNIIINPGAKTNEPALYLIDFDAFVRPLTREEQSFWFRQEYENWARQRSDTDPEIAMDAQCRVQQLDELVAFIREAVSGEASEEEQRRWLTGEYEKWRSRQSHPDADISREAHTRMDQASELLARLDGGESRINTRLSFMPIEEGGTFGTSGYCPAELEAKLDDDPTKHPFSDRFGRDMLLAELLLYDVGMGPSSTPTDWDTDVFYRQCAWAVESYEASTHVSQLVDYLGREDFLTIPERERLTSRELADMLLAPQRPALVPPISRALQHEPRKSWRRQEQETTGGQDQKTEVTEKPARPRKTMAWLAAGIVAALLLIFGSMKYLTDPAVVSQGFPGSGSVEPGQPNEPGVPNPGPAEPPVEPGGQTGGPPEEPMEPPEEPGVPGNEPVEPPEDPGVPPPPVNQPPVAVADSVIVDEGGEVIHLAKGEVSVLENDVDPEEKKLTATRVVDVSHGTLNLEADGTFRYRHDGSETTSDSFTYKVSDGELDSSPASVDIMVRAVNDPPLAVTDSILVDEGETARTLAGGKTSVLANDMDAEGQPLSARLVVNVSHGTLVLNTDGTFRYTHDGSKTTSDSFIYTANDGKLDSGRTRVSITITPKVPPVISIVANNPDPVEQQEFSVSFTVKDDDELLAGGVYRIDDGPPIKITIPIRKGVNTLKIPAARIPVVRRANAMLGLEITVEDLDGMKDSHAMKWRILDVPDMIRAGWEVSGVRKETSVSVYENEVQNSAVKLMLEGQDYDRDLAGFRISQPGKKSVRLNADDNGMASYVLPHGSFPARQDIYNITVQAYDEDDHLSSPMVLMIRVKQGPYSSLAAKQLIPVPGGKPRILAVSAQEMIAVGGSDGTISLITEGGRLETLEKQDGKIHALCFNSVGDELASCGDEQITLWSVGQLVSLKQDIVLSTPARCLAYSSDGNHLVVGDEAGVIRFYQASDLSKVVGEIRHQTTAVLKDITAIRCHPNRSQVVFGTMDHKVVSFHWTLVDGKVREMSGSRKELVRDKAVDKKHRTEVGFIEFSENGQMILTGSNNQVILVDANGTSQQNVRDIPEGDMLKGGGFASGENGQSIFAIGTRSGKVTLFTLLNGKSRAVNDFQQKERASINGLSFLKGRDGLVTISEDSKIRIWLPN